MAAASPLRVGQGHARPLTVPGGLPDYFETPNWANSPPLRKFVDNVAGLGSAGANNLGQYIPVAVADTTTYPGSDYYEIELVEYREKMHSDLPATLLRGYVQLSTSVVPGAHVALTNANRDGSTTAITINGSPAFGVDIPHYLGPLIIAQKDRPVRIKFTNSAAHGDRRQPLPPGGHHHHGVGAVRDQLRSCDQGSYCSGYRHISRRTGPPSISMAAAPPGSATERPTSGSPRRERPLPTPRASAWPMCPICGSTAATGATITACAGQTTCAEPGATNNPGPGSQTFYYTNQQSARLMFYHDHAWGITRLNVYVGEAAGYLIQDPVELALIDGGTVNGRTFTAGTIPADQIPLIIQDKTFVDATPATATYDRHGSDLGLGIGPGTAGISPKPSDRRPLVAPCLHAGPEPL